MISIIMNCYNGEVYLEQALKSVLDQTYQDWELIFWDNMSSDASSKIFKSVKDKRFKYFLSDHHDLLYAARNKAIGKASGNFLAFLDVDDFWDPKKLEMQINLFKDPSVGVVYSNFWIKNETSGKIKKFTNFRLPNGMVKEQLIKNYGVGLLTLMVRREAFKEESFNNNFHIIGDFDLCLRLSLNWNFAVSNLCLATYRCHGNNETTKNLLLQAEELAIWAKLYSAHYNEKTFRHLMDKILRIEFQHYLLKNSLSICLKKIRDMNFFLNKVKSIIQLFRNILFC